jgi:two-component system response regulator TctD
MRNRIAAFEAGADDFLSRPFAIEELMARVNALLRRSFRAEYQALTCGPLTFDIHRQQFMLDGEVMNLPFREHMLLHALIRRAHRPASKQVLFDRTFRANEDANVAAIEVLVHRLRKKLAGTPVRIISVRGFGYSLATAAPCDSDTSLV